MAAIVEAERRMPRARCTWIEGARHELFLEVDAVRDRLLAGIEGLLRGA